MLVANGAWLVVTNGLTDIGDGYQTSGSMTVTGSTFLAANVILGDTRCGGELTINNGTVTLSGELLIGAGGDGGFGSVSLNGGTLIVTNNATTLGEEQDDGYLTVSDGIFLARDVYVGASYQSESNNDDQRWHFGSQFQPSGWLRPVQCHA